MFDELYEDYATQEENGIKLRSKYTVYYEGYLFDGDSDGWNSIDYDDWRTVNELINAYGDMIYVEDNEYGVTWAHGEWF